MTTLCEFVGLGAGVEVYEGVVAVVGEEVARFGIGTAIDFVEDLFIGGLSEGVGDGYAFGFPFVDVAGFDEAGDGGMLIRTTQRNNHLR